jgi:hypothetical protein
MIHPRVVRQILQYTPQKSYLPIKIIPYNGRIPGEILPLILHDPHSPIFPGFADSPGIPWFSSSDPHTKDALSAWSLTGFPKKKNH